MGEWVLWIKEAGFDENYDGNGVYEAEKNLPFLKLNWVCLQSNGSEMDWLRLVNVDCCL